MRNCSIQQQHRNESADNITGGEQSANGSGYNTPGSSLSAMASPFKPKADVRKEVATPLVEIASPKGLTNPSAKYGKIYPGRRIPFCPWTIVENYHTWFVGKQNSPRVEPYFEKEELLSCQSWDFCYVWHPEKEKAGTYVLLVPTSQFQHLLDRINETLQIQLVIPPGTFAEKFNVIFGQYQTPIPRFLGRAADEATFDTLVKSMPPPNSADDVFGNPRIEAKGAQMYAKKIDKLLAEHSKEKHKKKKSDKNRTKRLLNRRAAGRQIKRVQRYMGLRQKVKGKAYLACCLSESSSNSDEPGLRIFVTTVTDSICKQVHSVARSLSTSRTSLMIQGSRPFCRKRMSSLSQWTLNPTSSTTMPLPRLDLPSWTRGISRAYRQEPTVRIGWRESAAAIYVSESMQAC